MVRVVSAATSSPFAAASRSLFFPPKETGRLFQAMIHTLLLQHFDPHLYLRVVPCTLNSRLLTLFRYYIGDRLVYV